MSSPDSVFPVENANEESAKEVASSSPVKISNDDAADKSDRNRTEAEEPPTTRDGMLEHTFEPGDHVIRWEMLPIAWPIQIHGIVLETAEDSVTLADFGLTAHQQPAAGNDGVRRRQQ